MFPSLLYIFVEGGFEAFLVEWIPFTDFDKTIFSICTRTPSRCQNTAVDVEPTMKAPSILQRKTLGTTCGIGVVAPLYQDNDLCGIIELDHLVRALFPHPCARTPICAKTLIITVVS